MENLNETILQQFMDVNSTLNIGDNPKNLMNSIAVGIVVNTDDPMEEGRLMVFCPEFNDNPKKIQHLPWASYCTPFGGSINNGNYARGSQVGLENSKGAIHYGFWGIPEQGAHVLMACINGDPQRRVWLGCLPEHQETHTLFNGRFKWEGGLVDGPFTSTGSAIQPAYANATEAFKGDRNSPEWKTRMADYQANSVREDIGEVPNPSKSTYLDNQYPQMTEAEQDTWVKPKVGSHGYDWTGYKGLGAFKSSRVYGMSTPGFHSFSMDDRAFNSRMRLKTTAGHQILLDDTNERIVISTYAGKASIEMDVNGNIDVYSDNRISYHAKKDINIESDETVRIKGKKGIHLYSGNTPGQTKLESTPPDGQIRMHATHDIHLMSEKSLRVLTKEDGLFEYGRDMCTSVGGEYSLQVEKDMNTIVNKGDINTAMDGSFQLNATANISQFAGNSAKHQAVNNTEIFAYGGKMDIAAQMDVNIKSKGENVAVESTEKSVTISGSRDTSLVTLDDKGISSVSDNEIHTISQKKIKQTASAEASVEKSKTPSPGCIKFTGVTVTLTDDGKEEHEADDDISYKLPDGVEESIKTINEKFDKIETAWDNHMRVYYDGLNSISKFVTDIFSGLNVELPLPQWLGELPLVFDFKLPELKLPKLTLPSLCFDLGDIFSIKGLELLPDSLFEANIDLGGWTKDNITGWVNGLKGQVHNLKASFEDAISQIASIPNQIQSVITQITNVVENIDLLRVNFTNPTGTDSDALYASYNVSIGDTISALESYNAIIVNNGLPPITAMISEMKAHEEYNNVLLSRISSGDLDATDFADLDEIVAIFNDYIAELEGTL